MRKINLFLTFWCFSTLSTICFAQDTISKDSLQSLLVKINDDYYAYNFKGAIENSAILLEEATNANDDYYIYRSYNELGAVYSMVKDSVKGKYYYEKALEKALESEADSLISWAYNDLANVYVEHKTGYEIGISYYKKAIEVNNKAGFDDYENLVQYLNIAWCFIDMEQPEKAASFLSKTQSLLKGDEHELLLLNVEILKGRYEYYKGLNQDFALELLTEAAITAEEKNYLEQAAQSHEYIAKIQKAAGDFEATTAALEQKAFFDKKIHIFEREATMHEASAKFGVQQYQKDLEIAKKEEEYKDRLVQKSSLLTTIFVIASIVLLIGLILFYYLWKVRKKFISKLRLKNQELTKAKEQAERLSNLKTQFFSTVSHELRTPLYGVIGLSSILMEDDSLLEHKDDLNSLKFSADYLLALINDVLTLNKIDANGIQLEKNPFLLSFLLKSIMKSFAFSLEQNNNKIHLHIDDNLPAQFLGDSVRLSQILMNLIGNAVKFNENGTIWVTIDLIEKSQQGNYVTKFTIKDDGIGIPKDKQATIFEEFSQVKNKNYNYQGTGLGLPIVKKLLALFNSEIELQSEVGKGAIFTFEIELEEFIAPQEGLSSLTTESWMEEQPAFENINILVVDDNRINQKITERILVNRHFNCSLASDGIEAVAMTKNNSYDLILMDIHMPNKNGIEATEEIRTFNSTTPIVALTAVEVAEIRKKIMDAGMNDVILKPYDVSQFLNTILRNLNTTIEKKVS